MLNNCTSVFLLLYKELRTVIDLSSNQVFKLIKNNYMKVHRAQDEYQTMTDIKNCMFIHLLS